MIVIEDNERNVRFTMGKRTDICAAGLGLALCFLPTSSFAQTDDGSKEAIKRFTAEQVFNLEYGDDPQISPDARTIIYCLLYTSPSPRDATLSRMPSSA